MTKSLLTTPLIPIEIGDARANKRVQVPGVAVRIELRANEAWTADALDLSAGGMFVMISRPLPIGNRFTCEIRIAGEPDVIAAVARVAWTRLHTQGNLQPAGMGVRLIDVEEAALDTIRRLVATRRPKMGGLGTNAARAVSAADRAPPITLPCNATATLAMARPRVTLSLSMRPDVSNEDLMNERALNGEQ